MPTFEQLEALTRLNLDDMFDSLGLAGARNPLLESVFRPIARGFARQVATYDDLAGRDGLPAGAAWILRKFSRSLEVAGQEHIPSAGPALIVSNHPGMADTVALFVAIGRPDLRIVAAERPFLRALPHTSRQLIYVPQDSPDRLGVVRGVLAELRLGRAVLTFPGGQIEPDPAALPGAAEALADWSDSVSLFARRMPDMWVIPALVSGVLSPGAQRNPLTRLRRTRVEREKMAAMLQIALPFYRGVRVRVDFGPPLRAGDLLDQPAGPHAAVLDGMRQLIQTLPSTST